MSEQLFYFRRFHARSKKSRHFKVDRIWVSTDRWFIETPTSHQEIQEKYRRAHLYVGEFSSSESLDRESSRSRTKTPWILTILRSRIHYTYFATDILDRNGKKSGNTGCTCVSNHSVLDCINYYRCARFEERSIRSLRSFFAAVTVIISRTGYLSWDIILRYKTACIYVIHNRHAIVIAYDLTSGGKIIQLFKWFYKLISRSYKVLVQWTTVR